MKSVAARIMLILVGAMLLTQLLSFGSVIAIRARESRNEMYAFMAADIAFVQRFLREQPTEQRERWLRQLDRGYYRLLLLPAEADNAASQDERLVQTADVVRQRLGSTESVRTVHVREPGGMALPGLEVAIDGRQKLAVLFDRAPPFSPPPAPVILSYLALLAAPIMLVAWLAVRLATAPLARFAAAARTLGGNLNAPPVPEKGPSEVVAAARALNHMQARIQHHLDERAQILAAVSHDLKTPLTRLRLRAEDQVLEAHRERFCADIDAMSSLVQDGLDYADSMRLRESLCALDLGGLLEAVVEDATDLGHDCSLRGEPPVPVWAAPRALRRVLQNLLDNAFRYGERARITMFDEGGEIEVRIEDDGPGIPPEMRERVFEPFFRLEHSRNRESGGTGLGLAIARNLVQAQQGRLWLSQAAGGGLCAHLRLPKAMQCCI